MGKGRARVYPVKAANLRTHQQQLKYADAALKKREVCVMTLKIHYNQLVIVGHSWCERALTIGANSFI